MREKFYITTAIAYASRKPHIGNTYEIILADAIARFKRMQGFDVHFVTGTDEHGKKVQQLADEMGVSPQRYVDDVSGEIKRIWDLTGASYDKFIRTTDPFHKRTVQKIFKKLYDKGDIYKGKYQGMYCVPCESFFTDTQLEDGKCPDCGREVVPISEEAYFFRMSKYQNRLIEYIETHPDFIQPKSREREMINNFLKPGLQDLCVSRTSFSWGIPVDFDPKHVVYVWLDALTNYITALGYDPDNESDLFKKEWPADLQIIGKDILRFHTIYWPILLMALDLPLPKRILGHPWLLSGNDKMSKSVGNVIYADTLAEFFSVDAVRFYLLHEMPYANDGSITYESVISVFNSELANTIGNLVKRTGDMIIKYFGGKMPKSGHVTSIEEDLISASKKAVSQYIEAMDGCKTAEAIDAILEFARRCNKYIDETTPWILAKDESKRERLETVLYHLSEGIRHIAVMLLPIMPQTAQTIITQLGSPEATFESIDNYDGMRCVENIQKPEALFVRVDADKKLKEIENQLSKVSNENKQLIEGLISVEDFSKVSLKVAEIISCEKPPKSKKLLALKLDDGEKTRQVMSGIAPWYTPEELVGKKVILVSNLKPAKLCGQLSEGMILAADVSPNKVKVLFVDNQTPNGSKIR